MTQRICTGLIVAAALTAGCANPLAPDAVDAGISGGPSGSYCAELVARATDLSSPICPAAACEPGYPASTPVRLQFNREFRSTAGWVVTSLVLRIGNEVYRSVSDSSNNQSFEHFSFALSPRPRAVSQSFTRARVYIQWNHHPDGGGQPATSIAWAEGSIVSVAQSSADGSETLTLRAYVDYEVGCSS